MNNRILSTLTPILYKNSHDQIISITCDDSFTVSNSMNITEGLETIPLSNPILNDITVSFAYDAYFDNTEVDMTSVEEQNDAIQEVKEKMFLNLIQHESVLLDTSSSSIIPVGSSCDSLLKDTITSMLWSESILGEDWNYYLGWKNQPDAIITSTSPTSEESINCQPSLAIPGMTCKPIKSTFVTQVPEINGYIDQYDSMIIQTQILQHIIKEFQSSTFVTKSIPTVKYIGVDNVQIPDPTDTIEDTSTNRFRDGAKKILSKFGISATTLLGFLTLFTFGIFGYKVTSYRRSGRARGIEQSGSPGSNSSSSSGIHSFRRKKKQEQVPSRSIYAHAYNDGIELVDTSVNKDGIMNGKFVDEMTTSNENDDRDTNRKEIQTGFKGLTLGALMESLGKDLSFGAASSTIDKLQLDEEEENDLLGIEDPSVSSVDEDMSFATASVQQSTRSLGIPPSPTRVRSIKRIYD